MQETAAYDSRLRKFASRASLAVAAVLVVVKFTAWMGTGSIASLTSAVDALVDAGASLVTYFGVRYAARPPDREHRFGHSKGEAVAGFTQASFLAGAALVLAFQGNRRHRLRLAHQVELRQGYFHLVVAKCIAGGRQLPRRMPARGTRGHALR